MQKDVRDKFRRLITNLDIAYIAITKSRAMFLELLALMVSQPGCSNLYTGGSIILYHQYMLPPADLSILAEMPLGLYSTSRYI